MSTIYDFIYTLSSEETQNESFYNSTATTAKTEYGPSSHFFVDENLLSNILATNYASDAFGPCGTEVNNVTTKFRTTSKVRASGTTPVKVFAIANGQVIIQPQTDDETKVNLILKPSDTYAPLKIKYFIYRGVNKSDLIDNDKLKPVSDDINQPNFLKKLWTQFTAYNTSIKNPITGANLPVPTEFPSSLIGYDDTQLDNTLIENYFTKKNISTSYQIPQCEAGEYLGNFTGEIGLDIVLDYGDYQLQNQEELFKLDLKFARKKEHIFDTTNVPPSINDTKLKRYKEYIHQFMDAAAFWGSHIECGTIKTIGNQTGSKTNNDIFSKILSKYQTKNKIYVYIQGENNRSYNYYDSTRTVYGLSPSADGELNNTSGWPIIIKELTSSTAADKTKKIIFNLKYKIDSKIPEPERHILVDVIAANKNNTSSYPMVERPLNPVLPSPIPEFLANKTSSIPINFQINNTKSCASFLFLYVNLNQEFPLKSYYNDLFPLNIDTHHPSSAIDTENNNSWAIYDKSRMVNLDDVLNIGASIQNKIFFDNGKTKISDLIVRKSRRLYLAALKRNSDKNLESNNLNFDKFESASLNNITEKEKYIQNLYRNLDFLIYKGTFKDGETTIKSLALFNKNSLDAKKSFFHLGITNEEYNRLVYDQIEETSTQYLPLDAENVFFHLNEIEDIPNLSDQNIQKFKVGLRYENNEGKIEKLFPSNDLFVYTLDGHYFFSKDYSEFQEFFEEYPKAKADFRTRQPYRGEYGFDWMRVKDTYMPDTGYGDYPGDDVPGDIIYKDNVGKLYTDETKTTVVSDINRRVGVFATSSKMYKKLELEYKVFPFQWQQEKTDQYYSPLLTIYPPYVLSTNKTDLDRQSIFSPPYNDDVNRVAKMNLQLNITDEPIKIELKYDTSLFDITSSKSISNIPKTKGKHILDITIKCLKEIETEQLIKVLAFYSNSTDGKIIGFLRVNANGATSRMSKKIALISVVTNINGIKTPDLASKALTIKKYLRQILITPVISTFELKLTNDQNETDPSFKSNYVQNISGNNVIISDKRVNGITEPGFTRLTDFLLSQNGPANKIKDYYKDHYIMFVFDEDGGSINNDVYSDRNGFSESSRKVIVVNSEGAYTPAHELLHVAGIPHSFTAYEAAKSAKFTYRPLATDNLMDYASPRFSLWNWQGKLARMNAEIEP
ncbi:hypothetical protein L1276_002631 [Flavobacterium sp. HSC-32F16]|uniref:hypothetical protein n=1 Tax=Flavobacterium sp. HSC-32F16 TaxID=2910964 RepID=UPI0020A24737|nr:hypothetical protein [Flavobacterium sp. HSC-32F16]MCP2027474.1 hypothetical protein [Flavobacterium sp. HSC-32F16]